MAKRKNLALVMMAISGVLALCSLAPADELHVPTIAYPTIQAAIDAAVNGDVVIVADGTYAGTGNRNIDFLGKAITVKSQNGPENCIIDCENYGRGFYFRSSENKDSILEGFTIVRANASGMSPWGAGGGIYCHNSSPMISNCILESNSATYGGGMFIFSFANPTITNCIFANNVANNRGGGIYNSDNSDTVITNCIFTGNWAKADHGGGFFNGNQGCPILTHCTFTGNRAEGGYGGGVYNFNPHQSFITLANCIFWLNIGSGRMDERAQVDGGPIVINYCCIQGLTSIGGTGNIGDDPLFAGPDDYWLLPFSPCIDAGIDAGVYMDIEGNLRPYDFPGVDNNGSLPEFDMGAYEAMPVAVAINIKPMSCPNPLNVKSKGVLPVAILGTEDVNVIDIDVASILLEGVGPNRSGYEDVAAPVFDTNDCNCMQDGPDGYLDLTLKFKTQEIVQAIGDVNDGDVVPLTLEGALFEELGGTPIEGRDCVTIRGKAKSLHGADINKDGVVNITDFAIIAENWLQSSVVED